MRERVRSLVLMIESCDEWCIDAMELEACLEEKQALLKEEC